VPGGVTFPSKYFLCGRSDASQ